jgi:hypothetical protein
LIPILIVIVIVLLACAVLLACLSINHRATLGKNGTSEAFFAGHGLAGIGHIKRRLSSKDSGEMEETGLFF